MTDTIERAPDATWTVTSEEQREFLRAYWRWLGRRPSVRIALCAGVGIITAVVVVLDLHLMVAVVALLGDGALFAAFSRWRVRHTYPVGETLRSWADPAAFRLDVPGLGEEIPWDRITVVDIGPTAVGLRTRMPKQNLLVARQIVGAQAMTRLTRLADWPDSTPVEREEATGERSVVVDRRLRIALCSAAARRFRIAVWIMVMVAALSVLLGMDDPSPWPTLLTASVWLLAVVAVLSRAVVPTAGSYPVGATISGSMGENLVIDGPWGRTSIHRSKLEPVAKTKNAIAFKSGANWLVVPRAILDEKSVSPDVRSR